MARTVLAVTSIDISGVDLEGAAPDVVDFNAFPNNGKQMLSIFNAGASPITITVQSYPQSNAPGGLTVSDKVITVAAGKEHIAGPFPPSIYNNASNQVEFNASTATDVKVKVLQLTANPG